MCSPARFQIEKLLVNVDSDFVDNFKRIAQGSNVVVKPGFRGASLINSPFAFHHSSHLQSLCKEKLVVSSSFVLASGCLKPPKEGG